MNSFKIKLKISPPKKDQAQDHHQDDDELEEGEIREANPNPNDNANHNTNSNNNGLIKEGSRVCHICNKTFCNGKALGGHMRVHTENHHHHHNPPKPKQPNASPSPSTGPNPGPDQPFRCNLCYKEFPSQKSLFGHMRSHPDRQWRGMQPPGPGPGPGRVVEVVPPTAAEERLRTMMGWGLTGRRGRAGSGGDDERDEEAAGELIMLQGGEERKNGSVRTRIGCKKKRRYDSDELYFLGNLGVLVDDDDDDDDDGNDGGSNDDDDDDVMVMMMVVEDRDGKRKEKRSRDLDLKEVGEWKCNTCKKYLSTQQELGGHNCAISVHKCKTCDKTFWSGQALGGHQRCHYMPSSSWSPGQTPTPTPTPSQCDSGRKGNVLEFDLNVTPSLEEDEGAIESTFGIS